MTFEMELFVAVVNDVKSVTIVIDSSFLVVRNLPLIIIFHLLLLLLTVVNNTKTIMNYLKLFKTVSNAKTNMKTI